MTGSFLELLFGLGAVFYKDGRALRTFKLLLAGAYTSRKGQERDRKKLSPVRGVSKFQPVNCCSHYHLTGRNRIALSISEL